ncbi:hypothetical protein [Mesorhizobium sp. LNJC394B00]|uniref:hypothetical protein n=1 Tax=Mesorhizobium sp. LNJC394B00 TaxID=1287274 RepID=UPI0003CE53B1|nr:hypothetical protein [Mesorhizobium sp. LNJC394B00]ESY15399.1 hypothetical protein X750_28225 [Mesorhizobium sp. LNJC394B00]
MTLAHAILAAHPVDAPAVLELPGDQRHLAQHYTGSNVQSALHILLMTLFISVLTG